ncbi:MAG: tellurite resistance/C4-dicarboxylate transporter family protein [Mycobacterium sp.]
MRPDAFAAVMATGIVSVAAADHGMDVISAALAIVAVVALPVLVIAAAVVWKRDSWKLGDLDTAIGLFTYVAACCVVAARFDSHPVVVWILGGLALQGWLSLAPFVVRGMWRIRWTGLRDRARGGWELASVATSGLAIVCVAADVVFLALIFWTLALCAYCAMTALIGWRATHEPAVRRNVPPDHWILMGGLAIATLAGDHIHHALHSGPIADAVRGVTIVTWVLASLWILPLAAVGWRRIRDWPAVFPLGMYSSATFAMAAETGWTWLTVVSLAFFWLAFALWLATSPSLAISARSVASAATHRAQSRGGWWR